MDPDKMKYLLNISVGSAAVMGMTILLGVIIIRFSSRKRVSFGLKPFVIAPGLNAAVGPILRASLEMELRQAASAMEPGDKPQSKGAEFTLKEMVTTPLDNPAATRIGGAALKPHADERGRENFSYKPAVRRLPPVEHLRLDLGSSKHNAAALIDIPTMSDALTVESDKAKLAVLVLFAALLNWKPVWCAYRVEGHVRRYGERLQLMAIVTHTRFGRLASRLLLPRRRSPIAARRLDEPKSLLCEVDLSPGSDQSSEAAVLGVSLAHKLHAATWLALDSKDSAPAHPFSDSRVLSAWLNASTAYTAGVQTQDRTQLKAASQQAAAILRNKPVFNELAELIVNISDAFFEMQDVDAAERTLVVLFPRLDEGDASRIQGGQFLDADLGQKIRLRLASIWVQQGVFEQAITILEPDGLRHLCDVGKQAKTGRKGWGRFQNSIPVAVSSALQKRGLRNAANMKTPITEAESNRIRLIAAAKAGKAEQAGRSFDQADQRIINKVDQDAIDSVAKCVGPGPQARLNDFNSQELCQVADLLGKFALYETALEYYHETIRKLDHEIAGKLDDGENRTIYLPYRIGVMNHYLSKELRDVPGCEDLFLNKAREGFKKAQQEAKVCQWVDQNPLVFGRGGLNILNFSQKTTRRKQLEAWYYLESLNDLGVLELEQWYREFSYPANGHVCRYYMVTAQDLFRKALSLAPNEWDLHNNLALTYRAEFISDQQVCINCDWSSPNAFKNFFEAKKYFLNAVSLAPAELLPRVNLALLFEHVGAYDAALRHYRIARQNAEYHHGATARKDVTSCVQGEARVLESLGQFEAAIHVLDSRRLVDDRNPELLLYLAILSFKNNMMRGQADGIEALGFVWKARSAVAEASSTFVRREGNHISALVRRADEIEGYICRCRGELGIAKSFFSRCEGESAYASANLAFLANKARDKTRSNHHSKKAIELTEERVKNLESPLPYAYERACIAALVGNEEDALSQLEKALVWQPGTREWLRIDPDFERIAGSPHFLALLRPNLPSDGLGKLGPERQ